MKLKIGTRVQKQTISCNIFGNFEKYFLFFFETNIKFYRLRKSRDPLYNYVYLIRLFKQEQGKSSLPETFQGISWKFQ